MYTLRAKKARKQLHAFIRDIKSLNNHIDQIIADTANGDISHGAKESI
jgi:hypothetical protein